ncbi:MAG: hypothetical protein ACK5NL_04415 [Vibrio fluvialis]
MMNKISITEFFPSTIAQLPNYVRQLGVNTQYFSYNNEFVFDALDDSWQLGTKEFMHLGWMRTAISSVPHYLAARLAIAQQAEWHPWGTIVNRARALSHIAPFFHDISAFRRCFYAENQSRQRCILDFFSKMQSDHSDVGEWINMVFDDTGAFLNTQEYPPTNQRKIWDPEKGAYNEEEVREIAEKTRLAYLDIYETTKKHIELHCWRKLEWHQFYRLGTMIAATLNAVLVRRGCQLNQMKWSDILPIQVPFRSHRDSQTDIPRQDYTFSDVEHLKLRVFRGKAGKFRQDAERSPHIIDPTLSQWILHYRRLYQYALNRNLLNQGIKLRPHELNDIMWRSPVFSATQIFKMFFGSKDVLFSALGHQSNVFHLTSSHINNNIRKYSDTLNLTSSRNPNLCLSNNRHRHTVGTKLARQGKDNVQISHVLGNTPSAANGYIDLDLAARSDIDEAMVGVKLFTQYSTMSVEKLKSQYSQEVVNEFDQKQGLILNRKSCETCGAQLGKPLGCYGCANFRPHVDGDHRGNLTKALSKLNTNQGYAAQETLRRIELCVLWIRATIWACEEMKNAQRGLLDENI